LRPLAFRHQRLVYGALMRSAAAALQALAADPRFVGVPLGCVAVLHTWTRALLYHPHVHLIVTAGGLSADRSQWVAPKHPAFLVPVKALSVLVRAKMCAAMTRAGLLGEVSPTVWTTPWVVHAKPAGDGARALDYLARYLFRVAICNSRCIRSGSVLIAVKNSVVPLVPPLAVDKPAGEERSRARCYGVATAPASGCQPPPSAR